MHASKAVTLVWQVLNGRCEEKHFCFFDYRQQKNACQIWAKQLNDTSVAVALYNSVSFLVGTVLS